MAEKVTLCEMSPRDGMQAINNDCHVTLGQRVELIRTFQRAGFDYIEAGSFVSPKVFPQFADTADLFALLKPGRGQLAALVPNLDYYARFADMPNLTTVAVFLSASDAYSRKNKRISLDDDLADARRIADLARSKNHRVRAHLSGAFRDLTADNLETDPAIVARVTRELIDGGCEIVALADTDGRATPADMRRVLSHLIDNKIEIKNVGVHLHVRTGDGLDKVQECYRLGVRTFDSSVGGIGGNRAGAEYIGNIATEKLVILFEQMNVETNIDHAALNEAIAIVKSMTLPSNRT